jgi:hypothetical protein
VSRAARKPREDWTGQTLMRHAPIESETSVLGRIHLAVAAVGGVHVMRNNVGGMKSAGRFVRFGLGVGSSDLVAIVAPHGRWLCLEIKRPEKAKTDPKRLEDQRRWREMMARYGAVVGEVRTAEEAIALALEAKLAPGVCHG